MERSIRNPKKPWARRGIGAILLGLAVVLPLFRQQGTPSWQTIWAEDGTVFFHEAHREGAAAVLFRPVAGYLQLLPRLLGAGSTLVPIARLPLYFALASTTVAALLGWCIYASSRGWVASRTVRLAVASQMVLMPALGRENTATIINVIWALAAAAPWALVSVEERPRDVLARMVVVFLAATSTALSVIYLPLAVGCLWIRRTRATSLVGAAFATGLVVQAAILIALRDAGELPSPAGLSGAAFADLLSVRVFAMTLIGTSGIAALWVDYGRPMIIAAPIVCAVIFACLARGVGRANRILALVFAAYAIVSFTFPVWGRGTPSSPFIPIVAGGPYNFGRLRFSVVPTLLMVSAAAVLLAPPGAAFGRRIARLGRPLFVAQIIVLIVAGFRVRNVRSGSPPWSTALVNAYDYQCPGEAPTTMVDVNTQFLAYSIPFSCGELAAETARIRPSSTRPPSGQADAAAER